MADEREGFVPVGPGAIEALAASVTSARDAQRTLSAAAEALLELAADMSSDAVRGLRERGATTAQIDRYEAAHREAARRLREAAARLTEALEAVDASARAIGE